MKKPAGFFLRVIDGFLARHVPFHLLIIDVYYAPKSTARARDDLSHDPGDFFEIEREREKKRHVRLFAYISHSRNLHL